MAVPPSLPVLAGKDFLAMQELAIGLLDVERRSTLAPVFAHYFNAQDLQIFLYENELDTFLPVPGFVPVEMHTWLPFLSRCTPATFTSASILLSQENIATPVLGVMSMSGCVLVLLGGLPHYNRVSALQTFLPFLEHALRGQQMVRRLETDEVQMRYMTEEIYTLTARLASAQADLQRAQDRREELQRIMIEELQERMQFMALVENCIDLIGMATPKGEVLYINPAGRELLGLDRHETISHLSIFDFNVEGRQAYFTNTIIPCVLETGRWSGETTLKNLQDDKCIDMHQTIFMVFHPETEEPLCMATVGHDITEQREFERRKDDFIRIASHELKTPITSIKGYTQLLQRRFRSREDNETKQILSVINDQSRRLTTLIEDLLDMSKIETGKVTYHETTFALHTLIHEVVSHTQVSTASHVIDTEVLSTADVYADRDRIGQVLTNLLTNAIKYSPRANRVSVRVTCTELEIMVSVQDFGSGIAPAHQQKIFERFYQIGDSQKHYPGLGLGLGLYITREIIGHHHGRLWVESESNKGATFHFTLPLAGRPS